MAAATEQVFADVLLGWAIAILTIFMCADDASRRGRPLPGVYLWIMFFTWPFSIAVYYLIAYRLTGLWRVLLWMLVFTLCVLAGILVTAGLVALAA